MAQSVAIFDTSAEQGGSHWLLGRSTWLSAPGAHHPRHRPHAESVGEVRPAPPFCRSVRSSSPCSTPAAPSPRRSTWLSASVMADEMGGAGDPPLRSTLEHEYTAPVASDSCYGCMICSTPPPHGPPVREYDVTCLHCYL